MIARPAAPAAAVAGETPERSNDCAIKIEMSELQQAEADKLRRAAQ